MGDEVFFAGVRDHFTRHRFANATMGDLFAAWERAGAADLAGWTSSWLRTAGVDRITLDRSAAALVLEPPAGQPAPVIMHSRSPSMTARSGGAPRYTWSSGGRRWRRRTA